MPIEGYVYVRAEYPLAIERLRLALKQARRAGLLGNGIDGTTFNLSIEVRVGAGAYVCGEETALLLSIQGQRGMPRPRPPFPAQAGLWGAPTLINNVETFAAVPAILREGASGTPPWAPSAARAPRSSPSPARWSHTGLVEVPMGTPLRTVVEVIGGGVPDGSPIKAVQTGGPVGRLHPRRTPRHAGRLREPAGTRFDDGLRRDGGDGSGTSMPEVARHFMRFSVNESCGKCVPCRAGTVQLAQLLDRFVERRATPADMEHLDALCRMVKVTSLCGLGQSAPNPVLSTLR